MQSPSLLSVLNQLQEPRDPRGVWHPFSGVVALALLGMLARIREMEVLVRWATTHWEQLREPLGFDRDAPPVATTISRTLALCMVADLQAVFLQWLRTCGHPLPDEGVVAVDGKTAKQALDEGRPLHMLNAFMHQVQITVGQWSVGAEKSDEPTVLRRRLEELITNDPLLKLLTGDALFAQRPLAELLTGRGIDDLFQIEANQGDTLDALENCFAQVAQRPPAAETVNKRGISKKYVEYGLIETTRITFARRFTCPDVGSRSASIANSAPGTARSSRTIFAILSPASPPTRSAPPTCCAIFAATGRLRTVCSFSRIGGGMKIATTPGDRAFSAVMAGLNTFALSIHRLQARPRENLRAAADQIAWSPSRGLATLLT
jgi:hypothetical protein